MKEYYIADAPFKFCRTDRRFKHYDRFPWMLKPAKLDTCIEFDRFVIDNFKKTNGQNYSCYKPIFETDFLYQEGYDGCYIEIYPTRNAMTMIALAYPDVINLLSSYSSA